MILAPDPAVPRRDALLRPATMAGVISQRLHGGVPVEAIERTYVKYRVGDSLRVVYRYVVAGETLHVAARTGRQGVIDAPEVGAGLFPFPHDRKLTALPALAAPSPILDALLGEPCTPRLVAYAAEQSASAECRDARGNVIAYAKVQRGDGERRGLAALAGSTAVRIPRVLADGDGVLVLEALVGRRLDHLTGTDALHALGTTLATLHLKGTVPFISDSAPERGNGGVGTANRDLKGTVPLTLPLRFDRLDRARLETAAEVVGRARPDAAVAAERLLERLGGGPPAQPVVTLHGDANLRNALQLSGGRVALLDLEHLATGPAAADLGQVLANLLSSRAPRGAASAFLAGYGTPPDRAALRWYTAASILARIALPAVGRFRPRQLAQLRELLDAGAALVTPAEVAA